MEFLINDPKLRYNHIKKASLQKQVFPSDLTRALSTVITHGCFLSVRLFHARAGFVTNQVQRGL